MPPIGGVNPTSQPGSSATSPTGVGSYGTIGSYTHGVWLVSQNGKAAIVDKAHLPAQGSGYEYYWLGATLSQAQSRLGDAMYKLGVVTDQVPTSLGQAFNSGQQNLNFDELQPGLLPWQSASSTSPYAKDVKQAGDTVRQTEESAASGVTEVAAIWQWLTTGSNWVRILEYVGGAVLIYIGIKGLTGIDMPGPEDVAKTAAKAAVVA